METDNCYKDKINNFGFHKTIDLNYLYPSTAKKVK